MALKLLSPIWLDYLGQDDTKNDDKTTNPQGDKMIFTNKKVFMGSMALLIMGSSAMADTVIRVGDRVYVSSDYVTCVGGSSPQPPPPPQPPPKTRIQVRVGINYSCMYNIPTTDGRSVANAAYRCEMNNPERNNLSGKDCREIQANVDHRLADQVIAKANTIIHEDQKDTVRSAATERYYLCEF